MDDRRVHIATLLESGAILAQDHFYVLEFAEEWLYKRVQLYLKQAGVDVEMFDADCIQRGITKTYEKTRELTALPAASALVARIVSSKEGMQDER